MNKTYTKKVSKKELEFYLLANNNNLTPKIISYGDDYVELEKYPCVLIDIPLEKRSIYCNNILKLVHKLHDIGILWVDIHEENIVICEDEVKLIDFGYSIYVKDYKKELDLGVNWFDKKDTCLKEYLELELHEIRFLCKTD